MANEHVASRASIFGLPLHAMLVPVPLTCFTGALATDIVYWVNADIQWANFSAWLLAIGILFGVLAAVAGLVDFLQRPVRSMTVGWVHMIGNVVVLIIALFNNFVHSRDGWTSVVPTGLILSALTVAVMIVTATLGHALVYRHGVGVAK